MPRKAKVADLSDYDDAKALRQQAGKYLKEIRRRSGLTQSALAEKVGARVKSHISNVERGRSRLETHDYERWAAALSVDRSEFAKTMCQYYDPHYYAALFPDDADSA